DDEVSHSREHSIEVQIPFLQHLFGSDFEIVPICMMMQDVETSQEVGEAIVEGAANEDLVIISSTDLTHYESPEIAEERDKKAINKILDLDPNGLVELVSKEGISMCGYGPVASMLFATIGIGAQEANLLKYGNSGDTGGPMDQVVGYGSIKVVR
ncbi:MAG: AmmeMemoRadiSam system protein B, partial [Hadesarchaea archaeon]|nr:AmmeMemoRadiSam system protein B [Hadesarchaea archaeon]